MDSNKREVRTMTGGKWQPRLREAVEGEKEGRTIEGYAIVFGVESCILNDMPGLPPYREIIEAGAITEERLKEMDIKMTMYHNREKILARSRNGEGTLNLRVDEVGVHYEFEAPNTVDGDTAIELVKRGDLNGSSFIFWVGVNDFTREKGKDGIYIHRIKNIRKIADMTIAADPAYEETTVSAREAEKMFDDKDEKKAIVTDRYKRERRERELDLNNF